MSTPSRSGFTAIEMMVVVSIVIVLVAMVVPTIGPAIKKGSVNDAANAIQRACSQARQLARTSAEPRATGTSSTPNRFGVSVVVPEEANMPAYAVVIYGNRNPSDYSFASDRINQYPNSTPLFDRSGFVGDGGVGQFGSVQRPSAKFPFSRSVMPMFSDSATVGTSPAYTFMSPGTAVGWYYHYGTGTVSQTPAPSPSSVNIGVPAALSGGASGTPEAFGVASLDMKYRIAVAIYKIGLLNSQDMN